MLLAGSYVGWRTYNLAYGSEARKAQGRCAAEFNRAAEAIGPVDLSNVERWDAAVTRLHACAAPMNNTQSWFVLGATALTLGLGLALMWLLPRLLLRKAGRRSPAPPAWQDWAEQAARDLGLSRTPEVLWGGLRLREAFTLNRRRRARIILPPGALGLPPEQVEAIIRHETAHAAAGDVTLVWLTRGVRWAVLAVLLIPELQIYFSFWLPKVGTVPVIALLTSPLSFLLGLINLYSLEYALRVLFLLAVAFLVAAALLRRREYEADLRSVHGRSSTALESLLAGTSTRDVRWWRRPLALHPAATHRLTALRHPELAQHGSMTGAAAIGLLAGMSVPALSFTLPQGPFKLVPWGDSLDSAGLIAGLAVAVTWGVPLWRNALTAGILGHPVPPRRLLLALPAGVLMGLLTPIWSTGLTFELGLLPLGTWITLATVPVAVAGAAGCSWALANLWSRRYAGGVLTSRHWLVVAAVNAALFTGAFWFGLGTARSLQIYREDQTTGGWMDWWNGYISHALAGTPAVVGTAMAAFALLTSWWLLRRPPGYMRRAAKRRCLDNTPILTVHTVLVVSAAAAAGGLIARWTIPLTQGPGGPEETFHFANMCAPALAGAACLGTLILLAGARGLPTAIAAAPLTTVLVSFGEWARHLTSWLYPMDIAQVLAVSPLALLGLFLLTAGLPAALIRSRTRPPRPRAALIAAPLIAALLAAGLVAAALQTRPAFFISPPQVSVSDISTEF
ncbi:M48 family metalloprotease [Streptomyces flavidovirens]|uniref:M48 family metalloprotease n=1 Tax=Streptomyces flavidovirens TaxID=67298 RepID=UPI000996DD96|nr:M48 family metalloprotease [Streptomyces flavidovirens]